MMLKKCTAAFAAVVGLSGIAGLIDHGDCMYRPYANVWTHRELIARKHFPELSRVIPTGLPRRKAWTQDVNNAAAACGLKPDDVKKLLDFVLDPVTGEAVRAPHPRLVEFELYASGKRELFWRDHKTMPPSWEKLLNLPITARKYTTIPVLRSFYSYRKYRGGSIRELEPTLKTMQQSLQSGCVDTQGCILDLICDVERDPRHYAADRVTAYRLHILKDFVNGDSLRWSYRNDPAMLREIEEFQNKKNFDFPDICWALVHENEDNLRSMCKRDPALRDMIVALGLVYKGIKAIHKVSCEFAMESVINYPMMALQKPLPEALKLLEHCPEHRDLRDILIIKNLRGEAKIAAIDKYIETYPDYKINYNLFDKTHRTSVTLPDHRTLHALAGAELFKLGRPLEAAERWCKGSSAEDLGMVAEQVMTIDELINFCEKHFSRPVQQEQDIFARMCARVEYVGSFHVLNDDEINFFIRNLLARRLMRAGRFAEARKYFTGNKTRIHSEKFFELQRIVESQTAPAAERVRAMLEMAALVRFHGIKLFGTFLEPDNLIARNLYPCVWGTKQSAVKLNKPALPRYSYFYRASELYSRAADMTGDRMLKAYALWTAGTLLKNISPKSADVYFKKLYAVAPELTEKNWFLPIKKSPDALRKFYRATSF